MRAAEPSRGCGIEPWRRPPGSAFSAVDPDHPAARHSTGISHPPTRIPKEKQSQTRTKPNQTRRLPASAINLKTAQETFRRSSAKFDDNLTARASWRRSGDGVSWYVRYSPGSRCQELGLRHSQCLVLHAPVSQRRTAPHSLPLPYHSPPEHR